MQQPDARLRELEDRVEREASIAELGRRALTGTAIADLIELTVADAARMLDTPRAAVLLAEGAELRFAASTGWPPEQAPPVPLTSSTQTAHVCLAREPSAVGDFTLDDRYPDSLSLVPLGIRSAVAVPIRGGVERALGVLAVHDSRVRDYTAADVLYLRALANILAASIARERAQATLTCLQETTARLTEARTSREIGEAMVSSGATCVEAAGGWVAEVSADGSRLEMLASLGYEESRAADYSSISLDERNPTTDAISRGTTLYFRSAAEFRAEYPDVPYTRFEAMAVLPVITAAGAVGVLALNFDEPRSFDDAERGLLDVLAKLFSQSLERARLYEDARRREWSSSLVARLSESLERATSVPERCRRAAALLAAELAGFAAVDLCEEDGSLQRIASSRRGSTAHGGDEDLSAHALATGMPQCTEPATLDGGRLVQLHALPLRARRRVAGVLVVATDFGDRERSLGPEWLRELADHVALAIDNARLFEREQNASRTLQLGLLGGELPEPDGAALTAAYRPGTVANEVGGDWYDAFELGAGRLAILVGDVVGHDLEAAVAMGQLRGAVRALAALGGPAELLERLDSFVASLRGGSMTTMAYAELDVASGVLRYACAGHPPPLAISAAGEPRLLWGGRSGPLGADIRSRLDESDRLEPGATLVLYTDGLIERRGESLAVGLDRLQDAARSSQRNGLESLLDELLSTMLTGHPQEDDVCAIACRPQG